MTIEPHSISVSGLEVEIVRKAIKNLHLGVYPPSGRVRVAAPLAVDDEAVRLAVVGKLGWIRRQQAKFDAQPRQTARQLVSGESHYFLGRRYRLRVDEAERGVGVKIQGVDWLVLTVRPGADRTQRDAVLQRWYRAQLRALIPPLMEKWQTLLGVEAAAWGIKRMKTRWGACNARARSVWLNLELAKKPPRCLEYVVLHELAHLRVSRHDERFRALLHKHMPMWQECQRELNGYPLAHEVWGEDETPAELPHSP